MHDLKGGLFEKVIYLESGGEGDGSSKSSPLPFVTGDLWAFPAGLIVMKVFWIIDVAITGTTALIVGDDDNDDGYLEDQAGNFATPGMYGFDAKNAGAYQRIQTAGATDALDIYVVPNGKYYSAAGKELKIGCTTANTAGKARVFVWGSYVGTNA